MNNEYMSIAQTAEFLGVSEITVKRFIREKLILSESVDGELVLLTEAVKKYKALADKFSRR